MDKLRYLLVADGSSDKALLHVIDWLLHELLPDTAIDSNFSDPRLLGATPDGEKALKWRIEQSLKRYVGIDMLFIHRDAEREPPQNRRDEIAEAIGALGELPSHICVVPVRMTEAWFLIDETAIRYAAGNPNGKVTLVLPAIYRLEELPNPKDKLHTTLRKASDLRGRRLKQFNVYQAVHRLAELIQDYSLLRQLLAFQQFEADVAELLNAE